MSGFRKPFYKVNGRLPKFLTNSKAFCAKCLKIWRIFL
jgi:hypothetical protein